MMGIDGMKTDYSHRRQGHGRLRCVRIANIADMTEENHGMSLSAFRNILQCRARCRYHRWPSSHCIHEQWLDCAFHRLRHRRCDIRDALPHALHVKTAWKTGNKPAGFHHRPPPASWRKPRRCSHSHHGGGIILGWNMPRHARRKTDLQSSRACVSMVPGLRKSHT